MAILVSAAVAAGFDCLLTRDQLFGESASRALKLYPEFAVVLVTIPQRPWEQYRLEFLRCWSEKPSPPQDIFHVGRKG